MFSEFVMRDTRCTFPAIIFCNIRFDIWNVQALLSFVSEGVKPHLLHLFLSLLQVAKVTTTYHDPLAGRHILILTQWIIQFELSYQTSNIVKWDAIFPTLTDIFCCFSCFVSSTPPFILQRSYLFCPSFSILLSSQTSSVRYNTLDFIINYLLNKFVISNSNLIFDIIIAWLPGSHCTTT